MISIVGTVVISVIILLLLNTVHLKSKIERLTDKEHYLKKDCEFHKDECKKLRRQLIEEKTKKDTVFIGKTVYALHSELETAINNGEGYKECVVIMKGGHICGDYSDW